MQDCDFLILGGGTAWASAVAALPAQASVILLEREPDFACHSIGRSAALLVDTYGPKLIQALTRASRTFLTRRSGPSGAARLSRTRGALLIAGERGETLLPELACDFGKNRGYLVPPEDCVRHRRQISASARRQRCRFKQRLRARSTMQVDSVNLERALRQVPILRRDRIEGAFFEAAALELDIDKVQ